MNFMSVSELVALKERPGAILLQQLKGGGANRGLLSEFIIITVIPILTIIPIILIILITIPTVTT